MDFKLWLLAGTALLAACGGGGNNSNDGDNSGDGGGSGTSPETGVYGVPIEGNADRYALTIDGREYYTGYVSELAYSGQPIAQSINTDDHRELYVATSGTYVDGLAVSYFGVNGGDTLGSGFGISGTASPNQPSGLFTYDSVYMAVDARPTDGEISIVERVSIDVNFDSSSITGETLSPLSGETTVMLTGTIDGNEIVLFIDGPLGQHTANGGFFGPNANELSAGFSDGSVSGLIFGVR